MDQNQVFGSLLVAAIVGLVTAVIKLWRKQDDDREKLRDLELKIANEYLKEGALKEVKQDVREIRELVHRLCAKLEVPVFTEPYR